MNTSYGGYHTTSKAQLGISPPSALAADDTRCLAITVEVLFGLSDFKQYMIEVLL